MYAAVMYHVLGGRYWRGGGLYLQHHLGSNLKVLSLNIRLFSPFKLKHIYPYTY